MEEADRLKAIHKKFNDPTLKFPYSGEYGEPGRVGGPGGQLFGFGKTSSGVLNIYANGGKGGNGQNGGNGKNIFFHSNFDYLFCLLISISK